MKQLECASAPQCAVSAPEHSTIPVRQCAAAYRNAAQSAQTYTTGTERTSAPVRQCADRLPPGRDTYPTTALAQTPGQQPATGPPEMPPGNS